MRFNCLEHRFIVMFSFRLLPGDWLISINNIGQTFFASKLPSNGVTDDYVISSTI